MREYDLASIGLLLGQMVNFSTNAVENLH